ncbi:MAG: glycosyltransferase N-terminal domain-containing protein, partial [Fibrobacter sp.]|nr:glycosyltransferase N-terminal domain-containing protein [Fibrobacter sp.]
MNIEQRLISWAFCLYGYTFEVIRRTIFPLLNGISQKKGWDLPLRQKLPFPVRDFRNRTVVWVHAASLGETRLLYKFLDILSQRHPDDLYLLTSTTKTGVQYLQTNRTSSVCATGYLPIDTIPLINTIVNHFHISRVWLLETELWPSMLWVCKKHSIPVGIVNARMEEKSYNRYIKFRKILSSIFSQFDILFAQNDEYADRFEALGVNRENIHIVGNIKSQIMIKRPSRNEWLQTRKQLNLSENNLVITFGCVHAGEGKDIRACFDLLEESGLKCKMILVPRHLDEAEQIIDEFAMDVVRLNDIQTSQPWNVCTIEKMGILDEMYKIADAAFIGGTFVDIGGHNIWDAAQFGIPVFFGPDFHTQKDSFERLLIAGVGFKANDGERLALQILRVMKTEAYKFIHAQTMFIETVNKSQSV